MSKNKMSLITKSSTAEYFSKNLQQVGFSSSKKAVLTTLKEAVDNALDACEEGQILPEVWVEVERLGAGSLKGAEKIRIRVKDNGTGIEEKDFKKVFGEYLASSKFGRGRCSRGQQGIGISAATTWAQLTQARGVWVVSKKKNMRKALRALVEVDIKQNHGVLRNVEKIAWDLEHGTEVDFVIDGKVHVNGEGGLLNYLLGTALVNPHLTLHYVLPGLEPKTLGRVSTEIPRIPQPTVPHPHTMKLGEFLSYAHLFQKVKVRKWLKEGFSRVTDRTLEELHQIGKIPKKVFQKTVSQLDKKTLLLLFEKFQALNLRAPSTHSVISVGEERLSKSMARLGKMDFFSVLTRKPTICDLKPVQVEVALGRFQELPARSEEKAVQVLRFANRVPLQFDKASCAIFKSITSVNWRAYGLVQHKGGVPLGPYVFAVSVVSPFIQFKNASKETIDASEQLVEEIRRALMQAGQKLSRYIRKEKKAQELEEKKRHIEQFGPILVETLCRIAKVGDRRKKKALLGLQKILGRDADQSEQALVEAQKRLRAQMQKEKALQQVSGEQKKEDQKKQRKEEKSKSSRSIKPVSLDTTL